MTEFRLSRRSDVPALWQLWKQAFGDSEEYLDLFFKAAYAPERSLVLEGIGGAAYWLDCSLEDRRLAYVYGVAVREELKGQGIGTAMMKALQAHLERQEYDGILLVPGDERLRDYYQKLGYRTLSWQNRFTALAGSPAEMVRVTAEEYAILRRQYLGQYGVVQEKENLALLSGMADFFRGDGFLAALEPGEGNCPELLGDPQAAPGITAALGLESCDFRTPGKELPYAMGLSLKDKLPERLYFGFGFD